jgi:hypothetical protein
MSTKELWSIASRAKKVRNTIYGFSGDLKKPYNNDDKSQPNLCIFAVATADSEIGYLFDNGEDEAHQWERIKDYIAHDRHYVYPDRQSDVANMILSLYNGQPMGTKYGRSKCIMSEPRYDDGTKIYDFRKNNLFSADSRISLYSNGYLAHEDNRIRAQFNGHSFLTHYDPILYNGIRTSVTRWKVNHGTRQKEKLANNPMLVGMVSDSDKSTAIAFAEIIYQYSRNVNGLALAGYHPDSTIFARKLIQNHKAIREAGLVCDHLTENRCNNFPWALALIPENLNKHFGERAAIAKPYFFFTVWDAKALIYKVKLGIMDDDVCWERRYSFLSLDEQRDGKFLYKEIFSAFKQKIGSEYTHTDGETYLRQWGDPERAYDTDNPLTAMVDEPTDTYPDALVAYSVHDLDEMPRITQEVTTDAI